MVEVLTLSKQEISGLLTMKEALTSVEEAYRAFGEGKAINPLAISFVVPRYYGEVDIKPAYIETIDCSGMKFAGGYWDNPKNYGLPSVIGIILLVDGKNGLPLAIMDGTQVGSYRTSAAGGVGAKYLARKDSENAAVIGTGNQGRMQLMALTEVFDIKLVKAYDLDLEGSKRYAEEMGRTYGIEVASAESARKAVKGADIIVTATPATSPVVQDAWIEPGTNINAIGADMPGKQELDPLIFRRAKAVVDYLPQCVEIGEIQHAVARGLLKEADVVEIGEIIAGKKKGRTSEDEITVFDSTGLGIQDVATAYAVYKLAMKRNVGKIIEFF